MADRTDLPRTQPSPSAGIIPPAQSMSEALASTVSTISPTSTAADDEARARITSLEREVKALGADPASALFFHEIGLLWEDPLKNPRNAAVAYQAAYKLAPRFLANIRAARRLFADVGNWQMVVQLIEAELAAVEDEGLRPGLMLEKAAVLQERLSREDEALKTYRQVLDLKPGDPGLLVQLETVYADRSDFPSLVEIYRLLAGGLEDQALRAHYLTAAGLLLEERLKQPQEAAECFRAAFALDRSDPLLLAAVMRVATREDKPEELLAALAAEAEALGPEAASTYLRISKVYDRLGRGEDALAALNAARRVSPKEALILSELAGIYEARGRHDDLSDVLLSWVDSISDEAEIVAINLRLAALYEEELKRDEDAVLRYRAVLARISGNVSALAGLGKLYYRAKN